jgi:hypothetical protein
MNFLLGTICGAVIGAMLVSVTFAKTQRQFESGTFTKLQICKTTLDEAINGLHQYERVVRELTKSK